MMTCEEFKRVMADKLGDELVDSDGAGFDAHIAECERCRREYQSLQDTIRKLRNLHGPKRVGVRRAGRRLIIDDAPLRGPATPGRSWRGAFRYAAGLFIAFTTGYALHAGLMVTQDARSGTLGAASPVYDKAAEPSPDHLHEALVRVYTQRPSRSDLAQVLIAMTGTDG